MAEKNTKNENKRDKRVDRETVNLEDINYKNVGVLSSFLSSRYKILPRKYTKLSAKAQRKITREIKKAREVGLLKYTERH